LAAKPSQRQAILQRYIEPQEGEEARRPTKAHHAIAKLVVGGAVRVILTNAKYTGAMLWKTRVDEHPFAVVTGTPKLEGNRLYVGVSGGDEPVSASNSMFECCKFRGSMVALDAATGKQIWKTYTIAEPAMITGRTSVGTPTWGPSGVSIWSAPTIDLRKKAIYAARLLSGEMPRDIDCRARHRRVCRPRRSRQTGRCR